MLLVGDVGGTKTRLGLFERGHPRPLVRAARSYATHAFGSFSTIVDRFVQDVPQPLSVDAVAIAVAGPVSAHTRARLTNVPWDISIDEIGARVGAPRARLLNDLEAMAYSIDVLTPAEIVSLQEGKADADGNAAVIAAGTGLGQALLHRVDRRYLPVASEGGHADFAARSDREMDLVRMLRNRYGRAEVEHVLSGPGLVNLHRFTHDGETCAAIRDIAVDDRPAAISESALAHRCSRCEEALVMFVSAYGAESGNLALRGLATGGVYLGGGIAPRILPALQRGEFMRAFLDKATMADLLGRIPVKVILAPEAGLLGAALYAQNTVA